MYINYIMYFSRGLRQFLFIQCGPEKPKGWMLNLLLEMLWSYTKHGVQTEICASFPNVWHGEWYLWGVCGRQDSEKKIQASPQLTWVLNSRGWFSMSHTHFQIHSVNS